MKNKNNKQIKPIKTEETRVEVMPTPPTQQAAPESSRTSLLARCTLTSWREITLKQLKLN